MAPALASLAAILLILASGASGQAGNTTTRAAVPATTTATPRVTTEASPVPGVLTTTFVSPAVSAKASPSPAATVVTTSSPATTTPDAVSTSNSTGNPVYTGFSCYVNAGPQAKGAPGAIPQPANYTAGDTYCYRAQMPNGTCSDANCTTATYAWNYGVADKRGCESFKESETNGVYKNVLCCATSQCNAPDATLDTTTVKLVNPDIPTVTNTTTSTADGSTTSTGSTATGTTTSVKVSNTSAVTTGSKATSGAGMVGARSSVFVVCLAALVLAI